MKRNSDGLFHVAARFAFGLRKKEPAKSILLVRTDGIGDFVFFTRYLSAIRDRYPDFKIVLCCRSETAPLAAVIDSIDEVIPFRFMRCRRNYFYRLRTLNRIRAVRPQVAVYLSFHRAQTGDEMVLLSGARQTVAFSGNDEIIHPILRQRNDLEYTHVVEVPDHSPENLKYEKMLGTLGCSVMNVSNDSSFQRHLAISHVRDSDRLRETDLQGGYCLIAPGGSAAIRRWPAQRFSVLADRLADEFHLPIVLCGNRDERDLLVEIAKPMKARVELFSSLDLMQVVSLIKRASAFVGNESGLLHVAASLNIPAVGILGGGHFSRYFPYGSVRIVSNKLDCYECNWSCKFPEPYCITEITVDRVMDVVRSLPWANS